MRRTRSRLVALWALLPGIALAWETHQVPKLSRSAPVVSVGLPERFVLVVWNVHKRTDSVFFAELADLVDSTQADLIMLQEFTSSHPERAAASLKERPWALSANLRTGSHHAETGIYTASMSLLGSEAFLSQGKEPLLGTRKPTLATYHTMGSDTLLAINLHALNFSLSLDGFRQQMGCVAELAAAHGGPVVAAGDFNTWSATRQRVADSILGSASLVRLDFRAGEKRKRRAFGHALDHVYYGPGFLRPDTAAIDAPARYRSSDHTPLVAGFVRIR